MAIATSVSSTGKGGLPGRDLQPALQHCRVYFYPLCDLLSQKLCPLFCSFLPQSSYPVPSGSELAPPPLSLFCFFIVAVDRWGMWGGGGRAECNPILFALAGWKQMPTGGWQGLVIGR